MQAQHLTLVKSDHASIEAARQAQLAERQQFEQQTGVPVLADGTLALVVGQCPICKFFIGAATVEGAENKMHAHLAVKHPRGGVA